MWRVPYTPQQHPLQVLIPFFPEDPLGVVLCPENTWAKKWPDTWGGVALVCRAFAALVARRLNSI